MRSMLFVPGDRPERFEKAVQTGADSVIVDLEDAVLPASKDKARQLILDWSRSNACVIRVNAHDTPWFELDVAMVNAAGVTAVMLPKTESLPALEYLRQTLGEEVVIFPLIETIAGVSQMHVLANKVAPQVSKGAAEIVPRDRGSVSPLHFCMVLDFLAPCFVNFSKVAVQ